MEGTVIVVICIDCKNEKTLRVMCAAGGNYQIVMEPAWAPKCEL